MGLDMYIYRASRVSEENLKVMNGMSRSDIDAQFPRALVITDEDYRENATLYAEILPYMSSIKVDNEYVDLAKIKRDNNIPEDAYVSGQSYDGTKAGYHFTVSGNKESYQVELPYEEMEKNYVFTRTDDARIVYIDEVYYWRKAYEIQDMFYAKHPVENCGYYKLSCDELEAIAKKKDEGVYPLVEDFVDDEDTAYFYHEWY